jgi:hypothetical protein
MSSFDFELDRWRLRRHESAHYIIARTLGLNPTFIVIEKPPSTAGHVEFAHSDNVDPIAYCIQAYAGQAAEAAIGAVVRRDRADRKSVRRVADYFGFSREQLRFFRHQARRLVAEHAVEIDRLCFQLKKSGEYFVLSDGEAVRL